MEYQEIISKKYGVNTADAFSALLIELPNVHFINTYYRWNLITADPDDNKYCDCAVAGKVQYIVTEDRHFDVLRNISFPTLKTISVDEFSKLI